MTHQEIEKEFSLSYYDLCSYLINKYGPAQYDYFCTTECNSKNKKVSRSDEGLTCHHMDEDKGGNLSNPPQAKFQPYKWQTKERLVYCNSIEHLILHIKIAVLRQRDKLRKPDDIRNFFTTGGIFMICQEINDLYLMPIVKQMWKQNCLDAINDNYQDYIQILRSLLRYIENNYDGEKSQELRIKPGHVIHNRHGDFIIVSVDRNDKSVVCVKMGYNKKVLFPLSSICSTYSECIDEIKTSLSKGYVCFHDQIYEELNNKDSFKTKKFDENLLAIDYDPNRRITLGEDKIAYVENQEKELKPEENNKKTCSDYDSGKTVMQLKTEPVNNQSYLDLNDKYNEKQVNLEKTNEPSHFSPNNEVIEKPHQKKEVVMNENLDKVISLYEFIREFSKLRSKVIMDISQYPWIFQLSRAEKYSEYVTVSYCDRVDSEQTENDISLSIMKVRKPVFIPCPEPCNEFVDWLIDGWQKFSNNVELLESIEVEDNVSEKFDDNQERKNKFDEWNTRRDEWRRIEQEKSNVHKLFSDLYRLYFELQKESETEELIISNGIIVDKENPYLCHPVLTHKVNLEYDPNLDVVSVIDTMLPSELYTVLFQSMSKINLDCVSNLNKEVQEKDYHPFDRVETPDFLRKLTNQLTADSIYCQEGKPDNDEHRIICYWEPTLILRKKLDGTVKSIEKIIENIKETGNVPAPILDIVSGGKIEIPSADKEESIEEQLASVGGESVDVLLSKEANKEQLEIAKRIEYYNAVLVQGPPGTGKTHTIANLLGHFLAQGKSVLVTSYTAKALSVLKEKVPKGLQNLCVSVLDDTNVDMERSIDGITSYMANTTSFELKREMESLKNARVKIINDISKIRRELYQIISNENTPIVFNGEEISPSKAAEFVLKNEDELSYIPGKVRPNTLLPLSYEDLIKLYRSNESISKEEESELLLNLPDIDELLTPEEFEKVVNAKANGETKLRDTANLFGLTIDNDVEKRFLKLSGDFGVIACSYPESVLIENLESCVSTFNKIEPWMKAAIIDGKSGGAYKNRWLTLIEKIENLYKAKETVITEQFENEIVIENKEERTQLKKVFIDIKKQLEEKKKLSKLTLMLHKEYSWALDRIKIGDHKAETVDECNYIIHALEYGEEFDLCAHCWNQLLLKYEVPTFDKISTEDQERVARGWIPQIRFCLDWYQSKYKELVDTLEKIGISTKLLFDVGVVSNEMTLTDKVLDTVNNVVIPFCDITKTILDNEKNWEKFETLQDALFSVGGGENSVCKKLSDALATNNLHEYTKNYSTFVAIIEKRNINKKREELLEKVSEVAPEWAEAIRRREGMHGLSTIPERIEEAWKWKQLSAEIETLVAEPFSELQNNSIKLGKEYRQITAAYAEKSGWYHLLKRTEADIDMKQALQGWRLTVKKIGKGTGKQAPALKAKARTLMSKCQNAVPAWIMPINRAIDTLNPKQNQFDVIIIDEASQADISSLATLYMGKKLIIVGDDKQVSPMAIGIELDKMMSLESMYIKGKIPNSHLYNANTSIYDIATTTFQPLMLREHFRCVPEIIGFSNDLSYNNKIKPLRDSSSNKLYPAVVNHRVPNGKRSDYGKTNVEEARTIVALIKACIAQKEYSGKTFGVISLLGDNQAKLIQQLIEKDISAKDIIERRILCGNSAHFQGDERDVIFLSLVDSNDDKEKQLHLLSFGSDDSNRKRYNVAVSRARDQIWVVNSLDSAEDLKPGDIRKTLIDYASNSMDNITTAEKDEEINESAFESSVIKDLLDRGYNIVKQKPIGMYKIKIAATYGKKTVAIECDGERTRLGENRIRDDMEKQTILERLGWKFIRIRGSEYYRYPEQTIDRISEELKQYGVLPEVACDMDEGDNDSNLLDRVYSAADAILAEETEAGMSNVI